MELKENHSGFSLDILLYHTITDTWTIAGTLPAGHITTPAIKWGDNIIIPSGEIKPGVRSPNVYFGTTCIIKSRFSPLNYTALIIYILILVYIGFYLAGREKGTEGYFLAGRRIPWWAAGMSIFGTQLSAITFMAIPAKAFATNWQYFLMNMGIVAVAPIIVWFFLPFYRRLNITTAYEYLEMRFNCAVRLVASALFIMFQLGRMGIILFLPAIALSTVTGINIYICIATMGALCTLYTVLGGIEAVIWTDVLQVFVLLGGAALSLIIIVMNIDGGIGEILKTGLVNEKFMMFDWRLNFSLPVVWVILISWLGQLIPYSSDQTVIQRYLTTKNERESVKSIWTNAFLCIPASILFFGVGTALFVFYKGRPEQLNPMLSTDSIFPWFIVQELPPGVSGIVTAGVFAAAMSSLDSSLNSISTVIVTDFYRRLKQNVTDHACLNLARLLTVLFGVIGTSTAFLMVASDISSLWDLFLKILGLIGGGLTGLFVLGIFTSRTNSTGAMIGIFTSAGVQYLVQSKTNFHFLLYSATGIISCVIAGYIASLIIPSDKNSTEGLTIHTLNKIIRHK